MNLLFDKVITFFCGRKRHRSETEEDELASSNHYYSLKKKALQPSDKDRDIFKKLSKTNFKGPGHRQIYNNKMGGILNTCRRKGKPTGPDIGDLVLSDENADNKIIDELEAEDEVQEVVKRSVFDDYEYLIDYIDGKADENNYYKISPEQFNTIQRYSCFNY
jgi:hypothetical protein